MDDLANKAAVAAHAKAKANANAKASPAHKGDKDTPSMHVKIYSPFKVYFDEPAASLSAENQTGPFDILPHHHNFITLLKPSEIVVRREGLSKEQRVLISGGIMHVKSDKVTIFLDV